MKRITANHYQTSERYYKLPKHLFESDRYKDMKLEVKIFIILYQIFKLATGVFLIGLISGLVFIEVYGIYLFFTERYLYTEDLAANGIWSFTTFYIVFNIVILCFAILKGLSISGNKKI